MLLYDRSVTVPLTERTRVKRAEDKARCDREIVDEEEGYDFPIWSGVMPLSIGAGTPEPDDRLLDGVEIPESVRRFTKARSQ